MRYTGIVYEDVEAPEAQLDLFQHARDGLRIRHVRSKPDSVRACSGELSCGFAHRVRTLAVHDHAHAVGRELLCDRESDALIGACDQDHSGVLVLHQRLSSYRLAVELNGR